jgi:mannose-1-phosphate guanylyltransferase
MKAMVLCAGLGTRLRPLTDLRPKAACPLLDLPLLWFQLALLRGIGVDEVVINTHHAASALERVALLGCRRLGLELHVSHEVELLDTGGGLREARRWLGDRTFLLLNSDMLFDADLAAALQAHRARGAPATLVLGPLPPEGSYHPVETSSDGLVTRIPAEGPPRPGMTFSHFTGVHVLEPEIFDHLPARGPAGMVRDAYRSLLAAGRPLAAHHDEGAWRDLGTPRGYLEANLEAADGFPLQRFAALPFEGERRQNSWIGKEAQVEGSIVRSVVGAGSKVPAGAEVIDSLVWPGTELRPGEKLRGTIAAGDLRISAKEDGGSVG